MNLNAVAGSLNTRTVWASGRAAVADLFAVRAPTGTHRGLTAVQALAEIAQLALIGIDGEMLGADGQPVGFSRYA